MVNSFMHANTITHGTPNENYIFIFKYFYEVEGWWGLLILFLFFYGFFKTLYTSKNKHLSYVILAFTFFYLFYATFGIVSKKLVFYGRLLHMYYPIIIIGAMLVISEYKRLYPVIIIFAFINYFYVINDFKQIDYPRSMIYEYKLFNSQNSFYFINELKCADLYDSKNSRLIDVPLHLKTKQTQSLILKNFCSFYNYPNDFMDTYTPANINHKRLVSKNHFMSHPAYTFEYCTKEGRKFFKEKKFKIEVYEVN
jgi:hypothetical protein